MAPFHQNRRTSRREAYPGSGGNRCMDKAKCPPRHGKSPRAFPSGPPVPGEAPLRHIGRPAGGDAPQGKGAAASARHAAARTRRHDPGSCCGKARQTSTISEEMKHVLSRIWMPLVFYHHVIRPLGREVVSVLHQIRVAVHLVVIDRPIKGVHRGQAGTNEVGAFVQLGTHCRH